MKYSHINCDTFSNFCDPDQAKVTNGVIVLMDAPSTF